MTQSLSGSASATNFSLTAGNLVYSSSVYQNGPDIVPGVTQLPPGCAPANCVTATANGDYPYVFNNAPVDGSFGVTSPIYLNEIATDGTPLGTIEVPNGTANANMVTSFSSKSELALNLSTDGKKLTFMGYNAPIDAIDVSNSNTPGAVDGSNPVPSSVYRLVATLGEDGSYNFTETNAYSGNNGRAAILDNSNGADVYVAAGNAGNGGTPQPAGIIEGAGAQWITPTVTPESAQNPGAPDPVGSFSVTELGLKTDKLGKDDNFRGLRLYNNVLYYTKGSGGNGIDTVYFVDTSGTACPHGVGIPAPTATLPTAPLAYNPATVATAGLPNNMCVLSGFPTNSAKTTAVTMFPFGVWFANPTTIYVADEGSGANTYANGDYVSATAQTNAGLQKWVYDSAAKQWNLAYTLQDGLKLGEPYHVAQYPTGVNAATGLPWSPATDGLRNLTGRVNADGTVTIWAISSTVSGSGDQGADPNKLYTITDKVSATSPQPGEHFTTVTTARNGEVLRGISFTPGS